MPKVAEHGAAPVSAAFTNNDRGATVRHETLALTALCL